MKDIILGIGNPILCDDGIGIYLAERLKKEIPQLEIIETSDSGFALIDLIIGYDRAIFIDSIKTGMMKVGEVVLFSVNEFKSSIPYSIHSLDMFTALEIFRASGIKIPSIIYLLGIEVVDNSTFSENFTTKIEAEKERIYKKVKKYVQKIRNKKYYTV